MLFIRNTVLLCSFLVISGCNAYDNSDLDQFLADKRNSKPSTVEPVPPIEHYTKVFFVGKDHPDPFLPSVAELALRYEPVEKEKIADNGIHPDLRRKKDELEFFELASLQFTGLFHRKKVTWAFIRDASGVIHTLRAGQYIGRHDGKVVAIKRTGIIIDELRQQEDGQYQHKEATLLFASVEGEQPGCVTDKQAKTRGSVFLCEKAKQDQLNNDQ